MTSIRRGLAVRIIVCMMTLFTVTGAFVYFYVRSALSRQFDESLLDKAHRLASMVEQHVRKKGRTELDFEYNDAAMPEFHPGAGREYFEIHHSNGSLFARSGSLEEKRLDPGSDVSVDLLPRFWNLLLPDGRPGRIVRIAFQPRQEVHDQDDDDRNDRGPTVQLDPPSSLIVMVARDSSPRDRPLEVLLSAMLASAGLMILGSAWLVRWSVGQGLRPLNRLADQAASIDVRSLDQRFAIEGLPAELRPISRTLNELLARLDESFQRESRFNADVAHELRTPIAELRSLAEVALKWPGDAQAVDQNVRDTLAIARQMEELVARLLALARCQAGRQPLSIEPVDVPRLIQETWQPFEAQLRARQVITEFAIAPMPPVQTDRTLLASVLVNLFSNAAAYTPIGGRIACSLRPRPDGFALEVANTNSLLTQADLPHLGEPFWRKDPARSGSQHCGLGLALVQAFAQLLGGRVLVRLSESDWFTVTLTR